MWRWPVTVATQSTVRNIFVRSSIGILVPSPTRCVGIQYGRGHTKRNATAISENCYQTDLSMWNWSEQRKLRKWQRDCNATSGSLRHRTPMQLNKLVFSQLHCSVVSYFQLFYLVFVIHLFVEVAWKVDEAANFVFVQLIEHKTLIRVWQMPPRLC
jgi:hypothetical protein